MSTYRFLPNLYTSDQIREISKKKWLISHGLPVSHCYVIILAQHQESALEILSVSELHKKFRRKDHYDVIGFASSRHGAFSLLTRIYADVYANTGDYHIKQYLQGLME